MEVKQTIENLRYSVEHLTGEKELLRVISDQLRLLRESFHSNKTIFTPGDISFLKNLNGISAQLQCFIDLQEELPEVRTLEEYEDTVSQLARDEVGSGRFARGPKSGEGDERVQRTTAGHSR